MNTIYFLPPAFFVQYTVTAALLSARACAPFFVAHMALRGGPVENPWKEGRFDVRRETRRKWSVKSRIVVSVSMCVVSVS